MIAFKFIQPNSLQSDTKSRLYLRAKVHLHQTHLVLIVDCHKQKSGLTLFLWYQVRYLLYLDDLSGRNVNLT